MILPNMMNLFLIQIPSHLFRKIDEIKPCQLPYIYMSQFHGNSVTLKLNRKATTTNTPHIKYYKILKLRERQKKKEGIGIYTHKHTHTHIHTNIYQMQEKT